MSAAPWIYRLGGTVGLVGGAFFVLINRAALPSLVSWAALAAWVVLLAVAAWAVWLRPRPAASVPARPGPGAGLVYAVSCAAMVAAIVVGARLLSSAGQAGAVPALVACVVGLHFLPFSRAFAAPFFLRLGAVLAVIGAAGLAAELTVGPPWAAGAAVVAGLAMTAMIARDATRVSA